jgi:acetyl-CoA synthetase
VDGEALTFHQCAEVFSGEWFFEAAFPRLKDSGGIIMSNLGTYEKAFRSFDWSIASKEIDYGENGMFNIGYYCSDRICELGHAEKLALIHERFSGETRKYTFNDLRVYSNNAANLLTRIGLNVGDRVCLFMDRIPELYFSFLGVLKMGGVVQPLFSAFGEEALEMRLHDAGTRAVFTTLKYVDRVRHIRQNLPDLEWIVILDGGDAHLEKGELSFPLESVSGMESFAVHPVGPEFPSVLHYTSGTTGKPKGALHVHSSIISQYITTRWVLDVTPEDVYWCTADPGWVTGTSYGIIGPWSIGVTQIIYDGGFSSSAWYGIIEKHKATIWYTAPTAIRLLMRDGLEPVKRADLSSLRHLVSVGEPLNAEAVHWSRKAFGRPFHDSFWQTETGSIVISNFPGMPIKPGSMGKPFPGIVAAVIDEKTLEPIRASGTVGLIALKPGWPSMFRTYWKNTATYEGKFKNGWYICGDRASVDGDGYFWFVGRDDDVINTGGHLVGPFEIESALLEHPAVAESAAVGKPDTINMEVVKAFIALKPGYAPSAELTLSIMNFVRKRLSSMAMPQDIEYVDSLPKTRSGKIMRRLLRAKEWGEEIGDTSTLEKD